MSGRGRPGVASSKAAASADLTARAGKTRVICLGLSALDQIWRVPRFFSGGSQKIKSLEYATMGGGMAATAAVAVARLGGIAAFWGRGGDDAAGREMRAALSAARRRRQPVSSVCRWPIVGVGCSRRFHRRAPDREFPRTISRSRPTGCRLTKCRRIGGACRSALARRERLRCSGPRVRKAFPPILDADVADADVFETLLPLTDHAVFSEPALLGFAGSADDEALAKVAKFGCGVAAVTRGADGVTWLANDVVHRQPAYAVDAVDTTGAGDVFHGAYALRDRSRASSRPTPWRSPRRRPRSNAPGRAGAPVSPRLKTVLHFKGTANENDRKNTRPGAAC